MKLLSNSTILQMMVSDYSLDNQKTSINQSSIQRLAKQMAETGFAHRHCLFLPSLNLNLSLDISPCNKVKSLLNSKSQA